MNYFMGYIFRGYRCQKIHKYKNNQTQKSLCLQPGTVPTPFRRDSTQS